LARPKKPENEKTADIASTVPVELALWVRLAFPGRGGLAKALTRALYLLKAEQEQITKAG
jgi:hypothetical protein